MKNSIIIIVVAVLVVIAGYFIFSSTNNNSNVMVDDSDSMMQDNPDTMMQDNSDTMTDDTKVFILTGENYKFLMNGVEAPDLVVNEGDKVRIELTSAQGFHDWVVDEFDASTERVSEGETTSVEFIADKKGTFEYYCSVGQHRELGMKGNLIVQ